MGWPEITFIVLWAFLSAVRITVDVIKGDKVGTRIIVEILLASVTFGLLIAGGFF
jgi:hypothetical protein